MACRAAGRACFSRFHTIAVAADPHLEMGREANPSGMIRLRCDSEAAGLNEWLGARSPARRYTMHRMHPSNHPPAS
jgi:hypothetical protein